MTQINDNGLAELAEKMADIDNVKVRECIDIKEYKLMYLFGTWITSERIYAESDEEAIYDADECKKIASDKLQYALWCGNRLVKRY